MNTTLARQPISSVDLYGGGGYTNGMLTNKSTRNTPFNKTHSDNKPYSMINVIPTFANVIQKLYKRYEDQKPKMQKTHHKSDFLTLQTFTNVYKRYEGDKFEKYQRAI